jgi:amino acid adenylation domain-containing protein
MTELQGYRLSAQQRRLWMLYARGLAHSAQAVFRVPNDVDETRLREAVQDLVARCEVLRTTYRCLPGMSRPLQIVGDVEPVRWRTAQGMTPAEAAQRERETWAADDVTWCHVRGHTEYCERDAQWLIVTMPALSSDAASFALVRDALTAATRGADVAIDSSERDPVPSVQYVDYAEWQHDLIESPEGGQALEYWRPGVSARPLEADYVRLVASDTSGLAASSPRTIAMPLDPDWHARLADAARTLDVDRPTLLLALWQIMLRRMGAGRAGTIGYACDGRRLSQLTSAVGLFARTLPFVSRLSPADSLVDVVRGTREQVAQVLQQQEAAALDLVAGDASAPIQFPLAYRWVPRAAAPWDAPGLILDTCDHEPEPFELRLSAIDRGDEVQIAVQYDAAVVPAYTARAVAESFPRLAAAALAHPTRASRDLGIRDRVGERGPGGVSRTLVGCRGASLDVAEDVRVHQLIERQAARHPNRPAVISDEGVMTFGELEIASRRLAHRLREAGAGADRVVALLLDRVPAAIVGLLAVWRAGAAFLAIHPDTPAARVQYVLTDAQVVAAIAPRNRRHLAPAVPVISPDDAEPLADAQSPLAPAAVMPAHLAYVLYTSGSTGQPKGVMVPHGALVNLCAALQRLVYADDHRPGPRRVAVNAPLAFDGAVKQIVQLAFGHTLVLISEDVRRDPIAFVAHLRRHDVDVVDSTPSFAGLLAETNLGAGDADDRLRTLLLGGEAIDDRLARQLTDRPALRVFNVYGPTECTVDAIGTPLAATADVTMGYPIANVEAFVLDASQQPVIAGGLGELFIGGAGVSRGYLGDPRQTARRFVPHPFSRVPGARLYRTGDLARVDGESRFTFLGRVDHQVKLRGVRIELGEIEATIARHEWVQDGAATVRTDMPGGPTLVAYVVPTAAARAQAGDGTDAFVEMLRLALVDWLPEPMRPAMFVVLDRLPLTVGGKVDRAALPRPDASASERVYASGTEEIVANIWAAVLQVPAIGRGDHFFERGGHSLLATQAMLRIRLALGIDVPLRALFECPTVAALSARIDESRAAWRRTLPELRRVPRDAPLPLSFAQQRLWFLDQLHPGDTSYHCSVTIPIAGALDVRALRWALQELGRRHEGLRTSFPSVAGVPEQRIHPTFDLPLPLVDLGDMPDAARQAGVLLVEAARQPFVLADGPLVRAVLVRIAADRVVLGLTLHHIITDGWSVGILVRDAMEAYQAYASGRRPHWPELRVQYADFAVWQRAWLQGAVLDAQVDYWRSTLDGAPPLLLDPARDASRSGLAIDPPRPGPARWLTCDLPLDLSARITESSRREQMTTFMLLAGAFQLALRAWSDATDISIGTDVANRSHLDAERIVGFFVNQIVLRVRVDDDASVREWLRHVREVTLQAYAHQDVPFERVVDAVAPRRTAAGTPLFDVKFVLQNVPGQRWDRVVDEGEARPDAARPAKFAILFNMREAGERLTGLLQYDAGRVSEARVRQLLELFETLLARVTDQAWMSRRLEELVADARTSGERAARARLQAEAARVLTSAARRRAPDIRDDVEQPA